METVFAEIDEVKIGDTKIGQVFRVVASGKEYSTFKEEIGNKAKSLVGLQVKLGYTSKQKGQYLNHYLEEIEAVTPSQPKNSSAPPSEVGRQDVGQIMGRNNIAARSAAQIIAASDKTPETIQAILDGLHSWSQTGTKFLTGAEAKQQTIPTGDDDIPF